MPSNFGQYLDLGSRGIIGSFYRRYEMDLAGAWAPRVSFMNDSTNQKTEVYKSLGAGPFPRKWVGGRKATGMKVYSITVENELYESTLNVNIDDLRRDKTGQIMVRVGEFSNGFVDHWNSLVTDLITNGATGGTGLAYDGQNFFDTDHAIESSGTINNNVTATEVPALNVTTAAAPTQSEMAACILGCVQYMYGWKDENANPVNGSARDFGIVVPVNLLGPTAGAIYSERLDGGDSNRLMSASRSMGLNLSVMVNPRLSTTTEFYVFRLDGANKPFILQDETGIQIEVLGPNSDHAFYHNEYLFGGKANRGAGYGEFLHALKATLS